MEKVQGIGGIFFRAKEPQVLKQWYQDHLGVTMTPSNYDNESWRQDEGPTVFEPFLKPRNISEI
jgi:glyoxylase I family protein